MRTTDHQKLKYDWNHGEEHFNISGDQGNMQQNFWEQGNFMRVNFREHLDLFLGNEGKTIIFSEEQGSMYPPWEALSILSRVNMLGNSSWSHYLRLLPTFAGGLREKIRTWAGFKKIPTNYISEESLINGVYDKSIV